MRIEPSASRAPLCSDQRGCSGAGARSARSLESRRIVYMRLSAGCRVVSLMPLLLRSIVTKRFHWCSRLVWYINRKITSSVQINLSQDDQKSSSYLFSSSLLSTGLLCWISGHMTGSLSSVAGFLPWSFTNWVLLIY